MEKHDANNVFHFISIYIKMEKPSKTSVKDGGLHTCIEVYLSQNPGKTRAKILLTFFEAFT